MPRGGGGGGGRAVVRREAKDFTRGGKGASRGPASLHRRGGTRGARHGCADAAATRSAWGMLAAGWSGGAATGVLGWGKGSLSCANCVALKKCFEQQMPPIIANYPP